MKNNFEELHRANEQLISKEVFGKPLEDLSENQLIWLKQNIDSYMYDKAHPVWKEWVENGNPVIEVSNMGQFRYMNGKPVTLMSYPDGHGYIYVVICDNAHKTQYIRTAHRIVATLFIQNPDNKPEINHINGIKYCNWYRNLEWVTKSENMQHAVRTGLLGSGENAGMAKYTEEQVRQVCEILSDPNYASYSFAEISELTGVSKNVISSINERDSWINISKDYTFYPRTANIGVNNTNNKFSEDQIRYVCQLLSDGSDIDYQQISEKTGVSHSAIFKIHNGMMWKQISKCYNMRPYVNNKIKYDEKKIRQICEMLSDPKYKNTSLKNIAKACNVEDHIVEHISNGSSWVQISSQYNLIKRNKGPARGSGNKYTSEQAIQVCQMLNDMYAGKIKSSSKKIAEEVGVSVKFVEHIRYDDRWKELRDKYICNQRKGVV